jgi:hypothetical protein
MGQVLVLYDSASGNTARMTGLVAEGAASIAGPSARRLSTAAAACRP